MELSEALDLRADTQKRIMQLRERLRASALVQEGEAPPEDPGDRHPPAAAFALPTPTRRA
jgi:hypothetical protein